MSLICTQARSVQAAGADANGRMNQSPAQLLIHGHYSSLQQRPRLAARAPPRGEAAAGGGGGGGGGRRGHAVEDVAEVVLVAGERDGPGRRREAVLFLRLPQQLTERRVAEVRHPYHEPPGGAGPGGGGGGLHAHSHVPRRHRGAGAGGGEGEGGGGGAGGVRGAAAGPPPPPPHGAAQPHEGRDRDRHLAHAWRRRAARWIVEARERTCRRRARAGAGSGRGNGRASGLLSVALRRKDGIRFGAELGEAGSGHIYSRVAWHRVGGNLQGLAPALPAARRFWCVQVQPCRACVRRARCTVPGHFEGDAGVRRRYAQCAVRPWHCWYC
jgi:hypothetical protein